MTVVPHRRWARAVFADDIREEVGNKRSIMGIYSGEMLIEASGPFHLPKLSIWISYSEPATEPAENITLRVIHWADDQTEDQAKTLFEAVIAREEQIANAPTPIKEGALRTIEMVQAFVPFSVSNSGYLAVRIARLDETYRAGAMHIRLSPPRVGPAGIVIRPGRVGLHEKPAGGCPPGDSGCTRSGASGLRRRGRRGCARVGFAIKPECRRRSSTPGRAGAQIPIVANSQLPTGH
jgi:hypothetical protein